MLSFTCGRCASASFNAYRAHFSNLVTSADTRTRFFRVALMLAKLPSLSFKWLSARLQCCEQFAISSSCARCADVRWVRIERLAHLTPALYSPRRAKSRLAAALIFGMDSFSEICCVCLVLSVSQVCLVLQECSANVERTCR